MNPESYTKLSGFIFITHVRSVHGMRKYGITSKSMWAQSQTYVGYVLLKFPCFAVSY